MTLWSVTLWFYCASGHAPYSYSGHETYEEASQAADRLQAGEMLENGIKCEFEGAEFEEYLLEED